jgi:6-phosphofructokinase 1
MKKIGILTRDCAGINSCVRAIVRTSHRLNINTVGVLRGYEGLIDGELLDLDPHSVSGIINLGGTILKSARSKRFLTKRSQKKAVETIAENRLDGLIIVGGDGSLKGAQVLSSQYGVPVVGIAATIDNDVNGVDLSIGADTAVNVALEALDKIRDTATSMDRIFVVEVMGRSSGWIALQVALAGGCEEVLIPEKDFDIQIMCNEINEGRVKGKNSWIIIVAEGKTTAKILADTISEKTGLETRIAVLGHIQRGGRPTRFDRILSSKMGALAVELMNTGAGGVCVGLKNGEEVSIPLDEATKPKKIKIEEYYKLIKSLI